jgi:hypothetical protein
MRTNLSAAMACGVMLLATALSGCSAFSTVGYWLYGNTNPPKFDGLKGKRVAVVCLDADSLKGPGSEADRVARAVATTIGYNVTDIKLVRPNEIADWLDNNSQDITDYKDIGRGVKADMVVGIDLESFTIHEGQTLLKGRASVSTRVYDMQRGGEVVYESPSHEISWPENGARHVTENEANFRTAFIHTLSHRIARDFYPYDKVEDFGADAAFLGNN